MNIRLQKIDSPRDLPELKIRALFTDYNYRDAQLSQLQVRKADMGAFLWDRLARSTTPVYLAWGHHQAEELLGFVQVSPSTIAARHLKGPVFGCDHLILSSALPAEQRAEIGNLLWRRVCSDLQQSLPHRSGEAGQALVTVRLSADDLPAIAALEQQQFRFIACQLEGIITPSSLPAASANATDSNIRIRPFEPGDEDAVYKIASSCHHHNQYDYDFKIANDRVAALYGAVITSQGRTSSDDGEASTKVLVAQQVKTDGNIAGDAGDANAAKVLGFISFNTSVPLANFTGRPLGALDFIGVDPDNQVRGIGDQLNRAALAHLFNNGVQFVVVRTMASNREALSVLRKLGYRITCASVIFHRWL